MASATPTPESIANAQAIMARRATNMDPTEVRKEFNANKTKLKLDVTKASSFGKKMKTFSSDAEKGILQDLQKINIAMFVSEASQGVGPAVWEGKMKLSDAVPFVNTMSAIHQRYESFLGDAMQGLQSGFKGPLQALLEETQTPLDMVNGVIQDGTKLRVAVRVMCELYLQGLVTAPKFFVGLVTQIATTLTKPNAHITVNILQLLIVILRAVGFELTNLGFPGVGAITLAYNEEGVVADSIVKEGKKSGLDAKIANTSGFSHIEPVSQTVRDEASAKLAGRRVEPYPSTMMAPQPDRDEFVKRVTAIADISVEFCNKLRNDVETKWRQLCEMTELQGEIAAEKRKLFGDYKRQTELFIVLTENLTAMMGLPPPKPIDLLGALKNSQVDQSVVLVASSMADFFNVRNAEAVNHYDTEEQREFYEMLMEIDELVPEGITTALVPKPSDPRAKRSGNEEEDEYDDYDQEENPKDPSEVVEDEAAVPIQLAANNSRITATYETINEHLATLLNIASAEAADQWVTKFLVESTKYFAIASNPLAGPQLYFNACRRKLQKALRSLGRCMDDTIPMVARVVATLSKRIDGLGDSISKKIEGELRFAIKKFSPTAYIRKTSMTRYLCELVKFRIAPPIAPINLFNLALKEIENPHSVQLILIMIAHVTSFLLRGGVTRVKAEQYLKELKEVVATRGASIGAGEDVLIQQALNELKESMTADRSRVRVVVQRERSPLEQYFRYLLFTELTESTVESVCKSVRKFPWARSCEQGTTPSPDTKTRGPTDTANSETHYEMIMRVLRKAHQCRWDRLHLLSEVVADTCDVYPEVGVSLVDCILEDIRTDLTVVSSAHHQALRHLAIQSMKLKAAQALANGAGDEAVAAIMDADGQQNSKSSLAKHLARMAEPTRSASGLYSQVAARSNQKMLVDLKYLAELFNEQVVTFRSISYVLAQLALFYPNPEGNNNSSVPGLASPLLGGLSAATSGSSSVLLSEQQRSRLSKGTGQGAQLFNYFVTHSNPVDYSRIRFICGFLDSFIPYVSVGTHSGSTIGPSEKIVLERFLARFFLLVHSKAKPFPMDLDYKLAETMKLVSDTLYPYPNGYEHLSSLSKASSHKAITTLSEVPKSELDTFNRHLDDQVVVVLDKLYNNKEWKKMSSSERRAARTKASKEILTEGNYSKFPKNKLENGVPYSLIGRLVLEDREQSRSSGKKELEEEKDEVTEAGTEIKETPLLSRTFYFPRSRTEAEAHLEYLLFAVKKASSARDAPGLIALRKIPVEPPMPKGQTLPKKKKRYHEDIRTLAISAIPHAPLSAVARYADWFELLCNSLVAAATTNSGAIFPVIGRGDTVSSSSLQQPSLETVNNENDEEGSSATATPTVPKKTGKTRATPVEGKGANTVSRRRGGQADSVEENDENADDNEEDQEARKRFSSENDSDEDEDEEGKADANNNSVGPAADETASSSDDDDEEEVDDRHASSDEEDDRGPAFGPQAFGLRLGNKPREAAPSMVGKDNSNQANQFSAAFNSPSATKHHHHARPEDAQVDRLMHQMLLESTGKAYTRQMVMDQRLEQRLSDGFFRKAIDNLNATESASKATNTAPPMLFKKRDPAAAASSSATAPDPSTPSSATGPQRQQFAVLRRNNKGNAEAKPLFVPATSDFAQRVEETIEEGKKEREAANRATLMLSRQQDAERGEEMRQKQLRLAAEAAARSPAAPAASVTDARLDSIRFTTNKRR